MINSALSNENIAPEYIGLYDYSAINKCSESLGRTQSRLNHQSNNPGSKLAKYNSPNLSYNTGLSQDILKRESWTHVGRTANIIIKDVIHIFESISKTTRILLMGQRNRECCNILNSSRLSDAFMSVN